MTSGSILRGSLRPGGGRTPPFLIIGLLVICGILGFNYWNLSAEYDTLVKEIGDLQDKFRIVALKRELAEKQSDAVERRYSEAEAEIGKIRISVSHKDQELTKAGAKIERQTEELLKLRDQLAACQALNVQINSSKDKLEDLRKKLDESNTEKLQLQGEKQKLITERQDMRLKLESLTFKLAQASQHMGSFRQPQPEAPQVPGKNSVQDENTISEHLGADENKEFRRNGNEVLQVYNDEPLQHGKFQEALQHNEKEKTDPTTRAHHMQQAAESPLSNPADETLGTENNSSRNIQSNVVKSETNIVVSKKNDYVLETPNGTRNLGTYGNSEKSEVKSIPSAQNSKIDAIGNAEEDKTDGDNLEAKYNNVKTENLVSIPPDVSTHVPSDNEEHIQAEGHEDVDHLQAEGPEVIHGHEVGDSLDDPNATNQVETDSTIKKTKDTVQTKEVTFPKDTLKENGPSSNEGQVKLVRKFGALEAPIINTDDEPNNTHTTVTLKETDAVAIANPDVDYPLNKQSAPIAGQENLSGNGVGMGGGEEIPQSMHAIPHTKDNGDYVDSKNAVPGLPVPKPSDDEKEGEDNDIPADKMKDIVKLPVQHGTAPRDSTKSDINRHNLPADISVMGKVDRRPNNLFPPFRNEGNLRQEQMQS